MIGMMNINPPPEETKLTAAEWKAAYLVSTKPEVWDAFQDLVTTTHSIRDGEAAEHLAALEKDTAEHQRLMCFEDFCHTRLAEIDKLEAQAQQHIKDAQEHQERWVEKHNLIQRKITALQDAGFLPREPEN